MQSWFLHYFRKTSDAITGYETHTLFDRLSSFKQDGILLKLDLPQGELPILILNVNESTSIINTTARFIRLCGDEKTSIFYHDFLDHLGFSSFNRNSSRKTLSINIKQEGLFDDFGIKLKTGEIIWWQIPTGKPGFGFWNITSRCSIIKYTF